MKLFFENRVIPPYREIISCRCRPFQIVVDKIYDTEAQGRGGERGGEGERREDSNWNFAISVYLHRVNGERWRVSCARLRRLMDSRVHVDNCGRLVAMKYRCFF